MGVFAIGAVLVCTATFPYLTSDFLYGDDPILVGAPLFGENILMPKNFLHYWIIYALSAFSSLLVVKSFIWVSISVVLSSFYFIVSRLSGLKWAAAALAATFVFYPVSVDQSFFVSGAHPTAATAVFFIYLVLLVLQFERGLQAGAGFNLGVATLQAIILYASGLISPTYNLAPFLLLISTAAYLMAEKARQGRIDLRIGFGLIFIAALPVALQIGNLSNYHYAAVEGWVSYSPDRIFSNFRTAVEMIVVDPFREHPGFAALYILMLLLLGLTVAFGFAVARPRAAGNPSIASGVRLEVALAMGVVLIVSSALLFGPSSIVTSFLPRYAIAPYMCAALLIAIILSVVSAKIRRRHIPAGYATNILLLAAATIGAIHYVTATRDALKPYIASHNLIANAVRGRTWKPDDQILILLPEESAESTMGFNHWSTWQLRVITGQSELIGLIGRESRWADLQRNGLFVNEYRDHGGEYWTTLNGRATRKRMMGLERDRALYAFRPGTNGKLVPATVAIWEGDAVSVTPPGERVGRQPRAATLGRLCHAAADSSNLFLALDPKSPTIKGFETIIDESFGVDGSEERDIPIDVADNDFAYISFQLEPGWERPDAPVEEYGDAYPAMPLLSDDLAIYNPPKQFRILSRNKKMSVNEPATDGGSLDFAIFGCPGKAGFVFLNGAFAGVAPQSQFSGVWRFGKGYKQRYWRGEVRNLRVGVLKKESVGE